MYLNITLNNNRKPSNDKRSEVGITFRNLVTFFEPSGAGGGQISNGNSRNFFSPAF